MAITIPFWLPQTGASERILLREVLDSNFLNDGAVTTRFEKTLGELLGCRYVLAVTSGTTALYLALMALGVGPGDEVIVPDVTFIATANAVTMTGAKPVLTDVDPETLNIDPYSIERNITNRTKVIMPVHVSGRAADLNTIMKIATKHNLTVVEDAAEALLSKFNGRALGTVATAGCMSFSPNKTITTGQGGAVFTDDENLYIRLRELKDQGRPLRGTGGADTHISVGFNFKFTNLQAAVGLGQLEHLNARLERMKAIYCEYGFGLADVHQVRLLNFDLAAGESPQWIDAFVEQRDELDQYLLSKGVQGRPFWYPLHSQLPYHQADEWFPNSTRCVPKAFWLPSAFTLTSHEIATVCQHIRAFYAHN